MYCKNCGRPWDIGASYCCQCGAPFTGTNNQDTVDRGALIGLSILGFFIPLAGLIVFIVYESSKPRLAKAAGLSALIRVLSKTVLSAIYAAIVLPTWFNQINNMINNLIDRL